jgi:predicted metal-dependent phosphoesterase TrpH
LRLDAHVHSKYSGKLYLYPIDGILNESYSSPESVYKRAKANGMDLVAITDHDSIDGVLQIAERDDVIVGCEVTAVFPADGVTVHLGVLGITEEQHREIQRLRHNVRELMPYLKQQAIFTTLNHVASRVAGHISASHIAALVPWVDGIEILNGTRLAGQNRTAAALAEAFGKIGTAGSDSHTLSRIGRTYLVADEAKNRDEFLSCLEAGRVRVEGGHGSYFTLASDILRLSSCFYREGVLDLLKNPLDWRMHSTVVAQALSLPLVGIALIGAAFHFIGEDRFNRSLLFDLVSNPATRIPEMA